MECFEQYDPEYTARCFEENLRFIHDEYFRVRLVGKEHIPFETGGRPVLFVGNHSGMTISWDNIMFDVAFYQMLQRHFQGDRDRVLSHKLVRLADPKLMASRRTQLFDLNNWWARTRCVPISMASMDEALSRYPFVYLSPEGVAGIGKGFDKRYQLQRFSSSFVYMAIKHRAIVVPVSIVNAEYLRPFNYQNDRVDRLMAHLGYPFFPIGLATSQLLFPATVLTPYPARLTYVIHEPQTFDHSLEDLSRADFVALAEAFRQQHQQRLDDSVRQYHAPYDTSSLLRAFLNSKQQRMFLPYFWHDMFLKTDGASTLRRWLYKIPLGFPAISLYQAMHSQSPEHPLTRWRRAQVAKVLPLRRVQKPSSPAHSLKKEFDHDHATLVGWKGPQAASARG